MSPSKSKQKYLENEVFLTFTIKQAESLKRISDKLKCSICQQILKEPYSLRCNHNFCEECIRQQFKHKNECPVCKLPAYPIDLQKNPTYCNIISALDHLLKVLPNEIFHPQEEHQIIENKDKSTSYSTCSTLVIPESTIETEISTSYLSSFSDSSINSKLNQVQNNIPKTELNEKDKYVDIRSLSDSISESITPSPVKFQTISSLETPQTDPIPTPPLKIVQKKLNSSPFVVHISPDKFSINDYYIEPTRKLHLSISPPKSHIQNRSESNGSIDSKPILQSQEFEEKLFQSIQPQLNHSLQILSSENSLPDLYTQISLQIAENDHNLDSTILNRSLKSSESLDPPCYSPKPHIRVRHEDRSSFVPFTPISKDRKRIEEDLTDSSENEGKRSKLEDEYEKEMGEYYNYIAEMAENRELQCFTQNIVIEDSSEGGGESYINRKISSKSSTESLNDSKKSNTTQILDKTKKKTNLKTIPTKSKSTSFDIPPKVCIIYSGLTLKEQMKLKQLCNLIKCPFVIQYPLLSEVYHKPTHLVVGTNTQGMCRRTLKYLISLSDSIWIVNMDWVIHSLKYGTLQNEQDYEIQGDSKTNKKGVPKISRYYASSHHGHHLFYSWIFYLNKEYSSQYPPVLSLKDIIQRLDGIVIQSINEFDKYQDSDSIQYTKVILKENISYQVSDGIHTVPVSWMLDCLGSYEILPFK